MVETIGRLYEKKGFGLITGKIIGLLTVMDKEKFTFDEIVEELHISKSTASSSLRILDALNMIEYIKISGDRKRYFQLKLQDKFAIIEEHSTMLRTSRDIFQSILELKADKNSGTAVFMRDVMNLISVFLDKFDELKAEYLKKD